MGWEQRRAEGAVSEPGDGHKEHGDGRARAAGLTAAEYDAAIEDLVSEMMPGELLAIPGVRDAISSAMQDAIIRRARALKLIGEGGPARGEREPAAEDFPAVVHRLIEVDGEDRAACGEPADAGGGSDVDPARVTCPACREGAVALPRTRTRERRSTRRD